ncbi:MAG: hypothetical protein EOO01_17970 [Chitinophagaceae bacterium]|nr:MAG: hypothetical protein EOO01_17970 [Chitinophagaceae bacterium]
MRYVYNKDAGDEYFWMPVMLNPDDEKSWLDVKNDIMDFTYPNYKPRLIAFPHEGNWDCYIQKQIITSERL